MKKNRIHSMVIVAFMSLLVVGCKSPSEILTENLPPKATEVNQNPTEEKVSNPTENITVGVVAETLQEIFQKEQALHIISIYGNDAPFENSLSPVEVHISGTGPAILVLSAYKPTAWNLSLEPGVILGRVIVNGYYNQVVSGIPAEVVEQHTYEGKTGYLHAFASGFPSQEADSLVTWAESLTHLKLTSFQASYEGKQFELRNRVAPDTNRSCSLASGIDALAPKSSCSGKIIAWGSMGQQDGGEIAAAKCGASGVLGSCCMYHHYGDGTWYLTDGESLLIERYCGGAGSVCTSSGNCR